MFNPFDDRRTSQSQGVSLPSKFRGQKESHFSLFILPTVRPRSTGDEGSPLGQVLGDTVNFFGSARKPDLRSEVIECSGVFPSFKGIHALPLRKMKEWSSDP